MKIDKETLIKHKFWALLACVVPLMLLALLILIPSAGGQISAKHADLDKVKADVEHIVDPKNPSWVTGLETRSTAAEAKKKEIWQKAWDSQEKLFVWPPELQGTLRSKNIGDPIDVPTCDIYKLDKVYLTQIREMVNLVNPVQDGGKQGAVQYKDGWENVIRWVKDNKWAADKPSSEDVWLAQEDVWVQRGLLQAVREADDSVGVFRPEAAGARPAAGEMDRKTFTNPDWKLELALVKDPDRPGGYLVRGDLTNLSPRLQVLGMAFRVYLTGGNEPEELRAEGEPLAPGRSSPVQAAVKAFRPTGLAGVEQVFDWRTVPVKRIDRIALGQQSHRTAGQPLIKNPVFEVKKEEAAPPAGGPGVPAPVAPPGAPGTAANQPQPAIEVTANGLVRNRYSERNDAVRRLPVAMVLVVDQAYIQNVLTALANSKLRIQTTQVEWQHFPRGSSIKPPAATPAPASATAVVVPGAPVKPAADAGTDDVSGNLVELVVYGVASLYERYPPPAPPAEGNK